MEYVFYAIIAVLAVLFRYNMALVQATKAIGTKISDIDSKGGLQDAITPPKSTNVTILTWLFIVAIFAYGVYDLGWGAAGIALALFFVTSTVAGAALMPGPESSHFVGLVYRSMVNRYADFAKTGDDLRADAIKELIDRVELRYSEKLFR